MNCPYGFWKAPVVDRCYSKKGTIVKPSLWNAILTDSHFWVPVVVLAVGITLLVMIK